MILIWPLFFKTWHLLRTIQDKPWQGTLCSWYVNSLGIARKNSSQKIYFQLTWLVYHNIKAKLFIIFINYNPCIVLIAGYTDSNAPLTYSVSIDDANLFMSKAPSAVFLISPSTYFSLVLDICLSNGMPPCSIFST